MLFLLKSQWWELLLTEVQNLLLHEALYLNLTSAHHLHWCLLLAPLLLHWLRLTVVLLLWLTHIADVAGSSESEIMVVASLASPTITWRFLLDFPILWTLIVWRSCPLVSKSICVFATHIVGDYEFINFFLNWNWSIHVSSFSSISLLCKFGRWHVLWLSFGVFIVLFFLASVAFVSAFEVVILALGAFPTSFREVEVFSSFWPLVCLFVSDLLSWDEFFNLRNWFEIIATWYKCWSINCSLTYLLRSSWWHIQSLLSEDWTELWLVVWCWVISSQIWGLIGVFIREIEMIDHFCLRTLLYWVNRAIAINDVKQIASDSSSLCGSIKNWHIGLAVFLDEVLVEFRIKFNGVR